MVARLWGTANGTPITFTRGSGDTWVTTVPDSGSATWVLALWAEDEAGNQGYFATVKLLYSARDLRWTARILDLGHGVAQEDVGALFSMGGPLARTKDEALHSRAETTDIGEEALA